MESYVGTALLLTACATSVHTANIIDFLRHEGPVLYNKQESIALDGTLPPGESHIVQKVNNFLDSDERTWNQRYFYNLGFYKDSNTNFLYVGGESAESVQSVSNEAAMQVRYARQFNARLFSLEHRFFGTSQPTGNTSTESYYYLNTVQALEDAANFIRQKNIEYGTGQKWISFGGSYPGALSLWLREKYPDLVLGAVGSSAPINNKLEFYQYLQVVENDIRKSDVRNNQNCAETMQGAFQQIRTQLQTVEGRDTLTQTLNIVPPLSSTSLDETIFVMLFSALVSTWKDSAQYGGLVGKPTISDLCAVMVNAELEPDVLKRLGSLIGSDSLEVTYEVDSMKDTDPNSPIAAMRGWYWLTCAEIGYMQTTDGRSSIFGANLPNNFFIKVCSDLFGITMDDMIEGVKGVRSRYGASDHYTGTNVLITNGEFDPWSALGKYDSHHPSVVTYLIPGAVHCQDLGFDAANTYVQYAQQLAVRNIDQWLNEVTPPPGVLDIPDHTGDRPPIAFATTPGKFVENGIHTKDKADAKKFLQGARRNVFTGRYDFGMVPPPVRESVGVQWPPDIRQAFVEQPLDHFNNTEVRTFTQKFYANNVYATPHGPNFLMIGGESPESGDWVNDENIPFMKYAKSAGANMYVLEHRYYGDSKTGTSDLQFLTSSQALYDIASFIEVAKTQSPSTGPWIVFGGSYSGSLAAWAREWFPELIQGAVASSAVMDMRLDYFDYLRVVEEVMATQGQACLDKTREAFAHVWDLMLTPEGRQALSQQFKFATPWNAEAHPERDLQLILSGILTSFAGVAQYSNDNNGLGTTMNISALCTRMTADGDAFANLVSTHFWLLGNPDATIASDFDSTITAVKDIVAHVADSTYDDYAIAGVLWMWQTCNEFGIFESTDYGNSIFRDVVPVNFYVVMCEEAFGITIDELESSIKRSMILHGGSREWHYKGSNVVLTYGSFDPWRELGLYKHPDDTVVPILIDGTAHVADMYPEAPTDSDALKKARQTILENIQRWIEEAAAETTSSTSTSTATKRSTRTTTTTRTTRATSGSTTTTGTTMSTTKSTTASTVANGETESSSTSTAPTTTTTSKGSTTTTLSTLFMALIVTFLL